MSKHHKSSFCKSVHAPCSHRECFVCVHIVLPFLGMVVLLAVWGIIGKCHLHNGTICIAITEKDFGIPIHTHNTPPF